MTELPDQWEAAPEPGWVEEELAEEFPALKIVTSTIEAKTGKSPQVLRDQLNELSDRISGPNAVNVRHQPIPWAYRVFFRHIGLDPDKIRTPIEQLIFERIYDGTLYTHKRVEDAITVAVIEVGVAIQIFDSDRVEGEVGVRRSVEGEGFEGRVSPLLAGTLVIADEKRPLSILFGATAKGRTPDRKTRRMLLTAIGVNGVPDIALDEGLWVAMSALRA